MSHSVIQVEGLSKRYTIGVKAADTLRARFVEKMGRFRGGKSEHESESAFWALTDVSFEVGQGDVLGVVGRNGAGKSTLLKILSRIVEPTRGRVAIHGRVGSLLEVGTGFHPELTGRENVYLNGAILGMRRTEIDRRFDEIVEFSGVERFIDTPVKRYSSGMYVRLAFAVAAHLEPEILIIDEVLAVGDASFQKKCLGKMQDVAGQGRTVLFVSHSMPAVMQLCTRCVMLEKGMLKYDSPTNEVIAHYLRDSNESALSSLETRSDRTGTGLMRFTSYEVQNSQGNPVDSVQTGQDVIIAVNYQSDGTTNLSNVEFSIPILGKLDQNIVHLYSRIQGTEFGAIPSSGVVLCRIPRLPLLPGKYTFNLYCSVNGEIADWIQGAGIISVEPGDYFGSGKLPEESFGQVVMEHYWSLEEEELVRR
jgi:lipopolysaccharide transport system ATP-binding protein